MWDWSVIETTFVQAKVLINAYKCSHSYDGF